MKYQSAMFVFAVLVLLNVSTVPAQTGELKLEPPQPKITTVSAMRARRGPLVASEEIMRLKLGTVVNAIERSPNQDTIGGKTDYWYRVKLPNGESGWLFGGLLLDYAPGQRAQLLRQIVEARLKVESTEFADRQEIYQLAASAITEAKDANTRGEFELLKLMALAHWAVTFPDDQRDKSPYREWLKAHAAEVIHNEFGGGYTLRTELLWNLEAKYKTLPIADRIAWEAARNLEPSDCEGDEVCYFFLHEGEIKYLSLHPKGAHAGEALKNLTEALTDAVIEMANGRGGDKYVVEQRAALGKALASLRAAVAKTSAPERTELIKKLAKTGGRR